MNARLRCALLAALALALTGCSSKEERFANAIGKGRELLAQGELDKASVEARNAVQLNPKSAEALVLSGQIEEKRQEF
jgi:Flp pilus assembly protein TadD